MKRLFDLVVALAVVFVVALPLLIITLTVRLHRSGISHRASNSAIVIGPSPS